MSPVLKERLKDIKYALSEMTRFLRSGDWGLARAQRDELERELRELDTILSAKVKHDSSDSSRSSTGGSRQ
jgi:hypothetical protein